jgi:uncharacterized protein (TIGR03118 family)
MRTLTKLLARPTAARGRRCPPPRRHRLCLESLEERCLLSPAAVLDPNLGVRTVVQLGPAGAPINPTNMVFVGDNDFLLIEKSTGKVDHIVNGVDEPTSFNFGAGPIANLPVNFASERGLLGITLSPNFASDHYVYLYWTENNSGPAPDSVTADVPLLGNRVDRFIWTAATSTLTFDRNIIRLHAFQNDGNGGVPTQMQGNHNGGVIHFGPDGKLYIVIGDNGRRGWLQNLVNGPNGQGMTDENNGPVRGGPAPDDAHLTGVMLRLNPDGSIPADNPFVDISASLQASFLSGPDTVARSPSSLGTFFTMFLNQAQDTFSVDIGWENLGGPTLPGGAYVTLGGADGPAILSVPNLPGGLTSGALVTNLTAANFIPEPAYGINTFADAVNAILSGQASFTIYTSQFPGGAITGQIAQLDPSVTTNLHKVFAYGIRNTFGFDFDPVTGKLWLEENGDISFDKISVVNPGSDNGWIQSSAPLLNLDGTLDDVALQEFRSIELTAGAPQQTRWPSSNIATTAQEAMNRLLMLPGAHYNPPVYSVRAEDPPSGLNFYTSSVLGSQYQDLLFVGEARDNLTDPREQFDGALFMFHLNSDRTGIDFSQGFGSDPSVIDRLETDGVLPNNSDFDIKGLYGGQNPPFVFGTGFGIATDIVTGPDGNLYVVSETKNAVYEIFNKSATANFHQTNLVADTANPVDSTGQVLAAPEVVDPNLQNPWGISFSATSPFWLANQHSGTSTLYSGDHAQPDGSVTPIMRLGTVVTIPAVTGTVANSHTTEFLLSNGDSAHFIFDGLNGNITAWANTTFGPEVEASVPGAVYTGLAIGSTAAGDFLYAANVSQNRIDVFDSTFALVPSTPSSFVFSDPNLPDPGLSPYRPFNVQNLGGTLYVAYRNSADPEHGGIVDAFDTNGNFLRRVVSDGVIAPWGLALAPTGFGNFGGALLVGNFGLGDGKINAYNPNTGQFLGYLTDESGNAIAIEGLWAIAFGNGGSGGDQSALYFAAGINRTGAGSFGAADGLFGSIRLVPSTIGGGAVLPPTSGLPVTSTGLDPSGSIALPPTVNRVGTATTLTSSASQATVGNPITFTVNVAALSPSGVAPTGTVSLMEGDTVLATARIDANGQAVFVFDALPEGTHHLKARFQGDFLFADSVSDDLDEVVTS